MNSFDRELTARLDAIREQGLYRELRRVAVAYSMNRACAWRGSSGWPTGRDSRGRLAEVEQLPAMTINHDRMNIAHGIKATNRIEGINDVTTSVLSTQLFVVVTR